MNRITAKLADVATISFAGSRMTPGFGSIEQHAAEIEREDFRSIDFSTSVEFGKFFPERWRLRIPMYYAYSRQSTLPEYDPLDSDIPLEVALDNAANRHLRDSIKRNAEDYVMRKSLNFTNVGIESKDGKSHFFDWSNLSLTYSYNKSFARNVNLERDLEKNYRGLISYIYNGMPPIVEPFKKSKSKTLNSKYLRLIKDFNFYYMPSMFSITSDITRNYREVKSKNLDNPNLLIEPTYDKDFMWTRDYAFKFNLTRNLVVDFHATTQARIDEPEGIVDRQRDPERYQQWKDTVWNNILDGGRPVNYNHDFSVQYTVPVNKLPFLDWTSLQLGYSTRYDWQAAAVTADSTNLGNVIRNASALQMNGDLSLTSLYNKSKFLREMIRPPRKQRGKNVKFETGMDKVQKGKPVVVRHRLKTGDIQARLTAADGKNIKLGYESVGRNKIRINSSETLEGGKLLVTGTETPHAGVGNAVARFFVGILTGFKTLSVGYSEDKGTTLPGFLPEARWLGQQSYNGSSAPGFKFLFGGQDENFGLKAAGKGWITTDSMLVERVPPLGHIPDLQGACDQGLLDLIANHDVQAVGQLVGLGPHQAGLGLVHGPVEHLLGDPCQLLREVGGDIGEDGVDKGTAAADDILVEAALALVDAHGYAAGEHGVVVAGVSAQLIEGVAPLVNDGVHGGHQIVFVVVGGDAHIVAAEVVGEGVLRLGNGAVGPINAHNLHQVVTEMPLLLNGVVLHQEAVVDLGLFADFFHNSKSPFL